MTFAIFDTKRGLIAESDNEGLLAKKFAKLKKTGGATLWFTEVIEVK